MALFAIIGPARTWGKRPLIMPDFVAGPIEFQQLSVVRTAFARPRMDLRTEERAWLARPPVTAIPFPPPRSLRPRPGAPLEWIIRGRADGAEGSWLWCSSRVCAQDQDVKEPIGKKLKR